MVTARSCFNEFTTLPRRRKGVNGLNWGAGLKPARFRGKWAPVADRWLSRAHATAWRSW
jgi:hypothetical protein